jgi:riboflavin kinase / FMN adenylyltransferase
MVKHLREISNYYTSGAWLTIGSFDGIHVGHQEIIRRLTAGAHRQGDPAVVVTFHPHPLVVLRDRGDAFYLTTPDERANILGQLGVDVVLTHEFSRQISSLSARDFILILNTHFDMRQLWIGQDFALGHNREGNAEKLRELGGKMNFIVNVVEPMKVDGQIVSSSMIRNYLRNGDVVIANKLLGRPYLIEGTVVEGDGRGKAIGIPTANLDTGDEKLVPGNGVYACLALFSGRQFPAATNIGFRPTFDGKRSQAWVETHILDFHGDLYGKKVALKFLSYLRGERKFNGVEDLIVQINSDIQETRKVIEEYLMKVSN